MSPTSFCLIICITYKKSSNESNIFYLTIYIVWKKFPKESNIRLNYIVLQHVLSHLWERLSAFRLTKYFYIIAAAQASIILYLQLRLLSLTFLVRLEPELLLACDAATLEIEQEVTKQWKAAKAAKSSESGGKQWKAVRISENQWKQ